MNIRYKVDHMNGPAKPGTIIFLHQGLANLDSRPELSSFRRVIQPILGAGVFKGEYKEILAIPRPEGDNCLIVVGLGKHEELTEGKLSEAAAAGVALAAKLNLREVFLAIPPLEGFEPLMGLWLLVLGSKLGAHRPFTFKTDFSPREPQGLKTVTIQYLGSQDPLEKPQQVISRAVAMADAQLEARRLTNLPANLLNPQDFAEEAKRVAQRAKLKITVWEEDKLALENAGAIIAVGLGSANPPRLVILEHQGRSGSRDPIALVGKGITFDSGGLCLKPSESMAHMKGDMAGAAVVLQVMAAASELRLPQRLVGVIPLAENMTGAKAARPGDIVRTLSGRTVEIVNTDAEGRLILCDALALALKFKPSEVIDIATLTGAMMVALGDRLAGLFCDDPTLASGLEAAGRSVGEYFWRFPFFTDYEDKLKSDLADLKHFAGRPGAAITAALVLRRFLKPGIPWAHLDIAGTSYRSEKAPGSPEGATGFGVRTILKYLIDHPAPVGS